MPALIGLLLLLGVALLGGGNLPFGGKLIPTPGPGSPAGAVCLEESSLDRSNIVLSHIPKPNEANLPYPNSDRCVGGGCAGAEFADYILAASNVKVERIWPNPPTTRLYKQKLPDDPQYDSIRDRVYRASCNDWCLLNLPYGGTFHCDFIFLLKEGEELIEREVTPGVRELYPKDGALFDVLMRKEAEIPEKVKCHGTTPTPVSSRFKNFWGKVWAQNESFIDYAGARWIYSEELTLVKLDLRTEAAGREDIWKSEGRVVFRGREYEAFKNLTNKINLTADWLYLVEPGVVEEAEAAADPYFKFNYLEFRKSPERRPRGRTLQLGTFQVPTGKGWWRKWVDESKPAIYLYPERPIKLRVKLNPAGKLTRVDPPYDLETGWEIMASPDGSLQSFNDKRAKETPRRWRRHQTFDSSEVKELASGKSYPYLFYEAKLEKVFVKPEGFVVQGKELVEFFNQTLPKLGLNKRETQDFIDYWMGRLDEKQPYYFIHFLDNDQIESLEPLKIEPVKPKTTIRLRAYFKPLKKPIKVKPQVLTKAPKREGFTLVEWGGILD